MGASAAFVRYRSMTESRLTLVVGACRSSSFKNVGPGSVAACLWVRYGSAKPFSATIRRRSEKPGRCAVTFNAHWKKLAFAASHQTELLSVSAGPCGTWRKSDARLRTYPIARIHGYTLSRDRLGKIVDLLCEKPKRSAKRIAGLSRDREDSIVGGALAIQSLVDTIGASEIVSGQGVREGIVYSLANEDLAPPDRVREAALIDLATRFSTWNAEWARRRAAIASKLLDALLPRVLADIRMALEQAAFLLDIGRSIDFFDRYKHAASMVLNTELEGFSHRNILLLSAIIANAHDEDAGLPGHVPFWKNIEQSDIKRAAILLRVADGMLQHSPRRVSTVFACHVGRKEVEIVGQGFDGWTPRGIESRFERLFGRRLIIRSDALRTVKVAVSIVLRLAPDSRCGVDR